MTKIINQWRNFFIRVDHLTSRPGYQTGTNVVITYYKKTNLAKPDSFSNAEVKVIMIDKVNDL